MDNQTVCPNCHESDKGCVQYGCWKRTPSTREEALQRIIADLEFHMRIHMGCTAAKYKDRQQDAKEGL